MIKHCKTLIPKVCVVTGGGRSVGVVTVTGGGRGDVSGCVVEMVD